MPTNPATRSPVPPRTAGDTINMRNTHDKIRTAALLLPALFFVTVYLLPLGGRVMIRPDEFRYAEIPREMISGGDWLRPRLNGVRYFEKPTLGYQLTAMCMKLFGENAFSVRFPAVLGTLLAAAIVWMICAKESRDPVLPGLAVGIYLSFSLVLGIGTFAVLDAPFSGMVTACVGAVYLAWKSERRLTETLFLVLAGAAAGAAFMLKGFLAFALPAVIAAPFLIWNRAWKKLLWWPWIPLAAAIAVAARWAWELHLAEPDFWRYFFVEEHWKRFTSGTYDRKAEPFWYFVPVLLGGMLPPGLLWIASWPGAGRQWLTKPFFRFMLCWAVIPFLLLSASSCKLGTYILPCFPPLAILLAAALRRSMLLHRTRYRISAARLLRWVGAFCLAAVAALTAAMFLGGGLLHIVHIGWTLATFACLMLLGIALLLSRRGRGLIQIAVFLFGTAPAVCCGMLALSDGLPDGRMPERGIAECAKRLPIEEDCKIAVERTCIASVCWTLKRSDLLVVGRMGEMTYGFTRYADEYAGRFVKNPDFPKLAAGVPEGKLVYITFKNLAQSPLPSDWPLPKRSITVNGVTALLF